MPGKGMTCWDKRELCDLNCVFSTTHEGTNKLTACSTGCVEEQRACTDSDETVEYIAVSFCRPSKEGGVRVGYQGRSSCQECDAFDGQRWAEWGGEGSMERCNVTAC